MEHFIIKISMVLLLSVNTILDLRTQEISLRVLAGFGAAGIVLNGCLFHGAWPGLLGGAAVGLLVIFISIFSKGAIGCGDGLLLCVSGIYLGFWDNLKLLTGGLAGAAVFSACLLLLKRADKKARLPFVPFLLLSYMGGMLFS